MGIETLVATLLPAFFPVIKDGIKMIISKFTGVQMGEPKTFQDFIALKKLEIEKLQALAQLDRPAGEISRWVADLRASFRYIAVGVIIVSAIIYNFLPAGYQSGTALNYLNQMAASATFFIIGDRVYLGLKHMK